MLDPQRGKVPKPASSVSGGAQGHDDDFIGCAARDTDVIYRFEECDEGFRIRRIKDGAYLALGQLLVGNAYLKHVVTVEITGDFANRFAAEHEPILGPRKLLPAVDSAYRTDRARTLYCNLLACTE